MVLSWGNSMTFQAINHFVVQEKNVDLFADLCSKAKFGGLKATGYNEEEFEREFAVRLDCSLNEKFIGKEMTIRLKTEMEEYLYRSSQGLIDRNEAKAITLRIFGENEIYLEKRDLNRLH